MTKNIGFNSHNSSPEWQDWLKDQTVSNEEEQERQISQVSDNWEDALLDELTGMGERIKNFMDKVPSTSLKDHDVEVIYMQEFSGENSEVKEIAITVSHSVPSARVLRQKEIEESKQMIEEKVSDFESLKGRIEKLK